MASMIASSDFSPARRRRSQRIPGFPRHDVATSQRFHEFLENGLPISEVNTRKKTFVITWRSWRLGGSKNIEQEQGQGLGHGHGWNTTAINQGVEQ